MQDLKSRKPRIALVHDWLYHMRGGEKVLEALYEIYPEADIYTLFYRKKKLSPLFQKARIKASFLQFFPAITRYYRWLLPLLPSIVRTLNLKNYDLIISSSHSVAKGIKIPPHAFHVCYCHTPMRYAWGFRKEYFGRYPKPVAFLVGWFLDKIKDWDLKTSGSVHYFVANSNNTRLRIQQFYGRDAAVIYPPINSAELLTLKAEKIADYYLLVAALVPYKRSDLAVEAFNQNGRSLVVVGEGPEKKKLQSIAGKNIRFTGWVGDAELHKMYAECRALIFPGIEDFGLIPVEVQACGRPVIARGEGGALETVVSGMTGVFFQEDTVLSLNAAIAAFEKQEWREGNIRLNAGRFSKPIFQNEIEIFIREKYERWKKA